MSVDLVNISHKQKNLTSSEHSILNVMAFRANENNECWPSIKSLVESTSLDKKTIQLALVSLLTKNKIIRTGQMKGKTKSVPVYKLILSDPKIGTALKLSDPVFTRSDPKIGTAKRSLFRDMERSDLKDQRKERFLSSKGVKTMKDILVKLKETQE